MGIWQHIHTVTTTEVSPDVGKFAEIIGDVRLYFSKPDIEISGGSKKKTGQTVIRIVRERADYEKIRRD